MEMDGGCWQWLNKVFVEKKSLGVEECWPRARVEGAWAELRQSFRGVMTSGWWGSSIGRVTAEVSIGAA